MGSTILLARQRVRVAQSAVTRTASRVVFPAAQASRAGGAASAAKQSYSSKPSLSSRTAGAPFPAQQSWGWNWTTRVGSISSSNLLQRSSFSSPSSVLFSAEPNGPKKPPAQNYYALFPETLPLGPPPKGPFQIDTRRLRTEFLRLQARAHPDLAAAPGDGEGKLRAQKESAGINEAYRVLCDPLARAEYLLGLGEKNSSSSGNDSYSDSDGTSNNSSSKEGGKGAISETDKTEDSVLLMEVLETHHSIEEAETEDEIEDIRKENEFRIQEGEEELGRLFAVFGGGEEEVRARTAAREAAKTSR